MPTQRRTTRRTAVLGSVGLGVAALSFTACDTSDLRPAASTATVTPSASSGGSGSSTPDEALVIEAASSIQATTAVVAAARQVQPLRRPLLSLLQDHRRHLTALGTQQRASVAVAAPQDAAAGLTAVRAQELDLQHQLVDYAVRAESGTLAALLASMSASVGQHLAALDAT